MKKFYSRVLNMILCMMLLVNIAIPAFAANVTITYKGKSENFEITQDGNEITNLFADFQGVMPGDKLNATITVKNDADDRVKVKIYMRALDSAENIALLDQLKLTVKQDGDSVLFEGMASEMEKLSEWKCLGTFYSGADVDLNVTLEVPIEMGNDFQNTKSEFQWEFKVEEFPVEPSDPDVPQTGDNTNLMFAGAIFLISFLAILILLILLIKSRKKEEN